MLRNLNEEITGGRRVFGTPFVGLLGSQILAETATGTNGAGLMFNDVLDSAKRYRMLLDNPDDFTGTVYENGAFTATASVSTFYGLYQDNLYVGTAPIGITIGVPVVQPTHTISVALDGSRDRNLRFLAGGTVMIRLVVYAKDGDLEPLTDVVNPRLVSAPVEITLPLSSSFSAADFGRRSHYRILAEIAGQTTVVAYGVITAQGGTEAYRGWDYGGLL